MQPLILPGLTYGLPFADYLKLPDLSTSQLKKMARSPMAFKHALDHPDHTSSPSQVLGSATHTAILEPHRMRTDYVIWDGDRRGKDWLAFKDAHADQVILKADEFDQVKAMRRAVLSHAPAARYLQDGLAEVTMQWQAPDGRRMRGRIDWLTRIDGQLVIVDLKTTRDATPRRFGADCFRLGYHLQFGIYADGLAALTHEDVRVVVLAVENSAPYEPAVYQVPEEVLDRGRADYLALLETLAECESTNTWPPAVQEEQDLALPAWAMDEDDDVSDIGLIA